MVGVLSWEVLLKLEAQETEDKIMPTVTIKDAQARLPDLIRDLEPGDSLVITENTRPAATLAAPPKEAPRPVPGRCKGMLTIVADDDTHLEDFKEYMP